MVKYTETSPLDILKPFIDNYWVLETDSLYQPSNQRIFPNACTDVFINLGSAVPNMNSVPLIPGIIYLAGTITSSIIIDSIPNSLFIGIRFKPGGFSKFYNLPLNEVVDEVIEFQDKQLLDLIDPDEQLTTRLDQLFLTRLSNVNTISNLTRTVETSKGRITVDMLAKTHCVSNRTLERLFNSSIGISPKEYIKVVRFQEVLKKLRYTDINENLHHVAFEMGYYDNAHLTNEFKRYAGLSPSELVSLYKTA